MNICIIPSLLVKTLLVACDLNLAQSSLGKKGNKKIKELKEIKSLKMQECLWALIFVTKSLPNPVSLSVGWP